MKNIIRRALALASILVLLWVGLVSADSIFDIRGMGRDIIPVAGPTRALGGAVAANPDPLAASILNPCASARARALTITAGLAHTSTTTNNLGEKKKTVGTSFPSVVVAVPASKFSVFSGLYLEKQGRISFAEVDTTLPGNVIYDVTYKREISINSVPVLLSTAISRRLVLAAGIIVSFCDMREEQIIDFRDSKYSDADDVMDTYAMGEGFAAAFQIDLDRVRLGGILRTAPDLNGELERRNSPIGLWSTEKIEISSKDAFRLGLQALPIRAVSVEVDYDRAPWSRLRLNDEILSDKMVERWAVGIQYRGDYLWRGSKYPINLGYYRQPLDWEGESQAGIATGEITEEVYSLGTSIPIVQDRASIALSLEIGSRKTEMRSNLDERFYGLSLSISAIEAWQREIRR